jgi:hypothetical protein
LIFGLFCVPFVKEIVKQMLSNFLPQSNWIFFQYNVKYLYVFHRKWDFISMLIKVKRLTIFFVQEILIIVGIFKYQLQDQENTIFKYLWTSLPSVLLQIIKCRVSSTALILSDSILLGVKLNFGEKLLWVQTKTLSGQDLATPVMTL